MRVLHSCDNFIFKIVELFSGWNQKQLFERLHDIQQNDIQQNDIQQNDIQQNDI